MPGKLPWIQCPQCKGHGEIPLPLILSEVLHIVQRHSKRGSITVEQVYAELKQPGIGTTAINNRMTALERAGFVRRSGKIGKCWQWKSANKSHERNKV